MSAVTSDAVFVVRFFQASVTAVLLTSICSSRVSLVLYPGRPKLVTYSQYRTFESSQIESNLPVYCIRNALVNVDVTNRRITFISITYQVSHFVLRFFHEHVREASNTQAVVVLYIVTSGDSPYIGLIETA